ncbi:MAG: glycosyltransferase family 4 protein [Chthoniobacterales bacterium]
MLYSFPHKLGGPRICGIAWHQVKGIHDAGAEVDAFPGVLSRPVPAAVRVKSTLARGRFRIPYKVLGRVRACMLHDYIVARQLKKLRHEIDVIHAWPLGALRTLEAAAKYNIPTVLERCNAHTRFAYEVVQEECDRLGVQLPPGHEHFYDTQVLEREEEEYRLADKLLCPSEFVAKTFVEKGFPSDRVLRHIYGFDPNVYYPNGRTRDPGEGLKALFVGVCAVRKGVHYALEAWLQSTAHHKGTFQIAGEFLPAYAEKLSPLLAHPSVKVLGHRNDVPQLMRDSDVLLLPSIEEGFGLVVAEAMGSGCVPLISDACTDICSHMENGLIHRAGDVPTLSEHLTMLDQNRDVLHKFSAAGLAASPQFTWDAAGKQLVKAYEAARSG